MTRFQLLGRGSVLMVGEGDHDYVCGRCGRLLLYRMQEHQVLGGWFDCPKCGWLNGIDIELGWAIYVVEQLTSLELTAERLREVVETLRATPADQVADVAARELGSAGGWLARISGGLVVAVLALLVQIYYGQASLDVSRESRDLARDAVDQQRQQPRQITPADVRRVATELHRLQREIEVRPPKSPRRRGGSRKGRGRGSR
jgi:predicted RNA-binding Zn-ribbon protein involved in translation (DUF1610 family)